jgi:hypothetical protein
MTHSIYMVPAWQRLISHDTHTCSKLHLQQCPRCNRTMAPLKRVEKRSKTKNLLQVLDASASGCEDSTACTTVAAHLSKLVPKPSATRILVTHSFNVFWMSGKLVQVLRISLHTRYQQNGYSHQHVHTGCQRKTPAAVKTTLYRSMQIVSK